MRGLKVQGMEALKHLLGTSKGGSLLPPPKMTMRKKKHLQLLEEMLLPMWTPLTTLFVQYRATCHKVMVITKFLEAHKITIVMWPE